MMMMIRCSSGNVNRRANGCSQVHIVIIMVFTQGQLSDIKSLAKNAVEEHFEASGGLENLILKISSAVVEKLEVKFNKLEKLIEKCSNLESNVNNLLKDNEDLFKKFDSLEQYTRRNSVRIFGMEEKKDEIVEDSVLEVFNKQLGPECIDRCHRIGSYSQSNQTDLKRARPRAIIVKFCSYRYRDTVFRNKKKLRGSKIAIKEDLTKCRVDLLNCAAEKFGFKNVWSRDGAINLIKNGKRFVVNSMQELEKLCD